MRRWTGLSPSLKAGDGAVADDIRGVIKKTAIHAPVQRRGDVARHKRPGRGGFHRIGLDVFVVVAVAIAVAIAKRLGLGAFDGQFRLLRRILAFRCHNKMSPPP
jgi:hypothetical protein